MSDRLDHSLFVSVLGLHRHDRIRVPICSIAFKQKQNSSKKILMFQVSDTKWYLMVYFPCNVNPSLPLSWHLWAILYKIRMCKYRISLWNIFFAVKIALKYDVCMLSCQKFQIWILFLLMKKKAKQSGGMALGLWFGYSLLVFLLPAVQGSRPVATPALTNTIYPSTKAPGRGWGDLNFSLPYMMQGLQEGFVPRTSRPWLLFDFSVLCVRVCVCVWACEMCACTCMCMCVFTYTHLLFSVIL